MFILFITHFFPPKYNAGTENYTFGLARALQARGHKIQVICAENWDNGNHYWNEITKDNYEGLAVQRIHLNWTRAADPNRVLYDSPKVERYLDDFIKRNNPDIVHVTSTYSLGIGVIRSATRLNIPLVLTLMDFWFICPRTILEKSNGQLCDGLTTSWECQQCLLFYSGVYKLLHHLLSPKIEEKLWKHISQKPRISRLRSARGMALNMIERKADMEEILNCPDVIISHSQFVRDIFFMTGIVNKIVYLPNGHKLDWLSEYQGKTHSPNIRFGYIGQISEHKGVHVLINAYKNANLYDKSELVIWGDLSRDPSYINQLSDDIDDCNQIILRGPFSRDQLPEVFSDIDVLVVPSLWYENAPLVIREAFATKTPVITTNLGGMAEAVKHDVNGLLFERGNIDDLANQLQRITDEPGLIERLREGVPPVKRIEEEVTELELIYQQLVK